MKTAIVIATYNEAANIAELLRRLHAAAPDARIIFVDDNSPDKTAEAVRGYGTPLSVDVIVRVGERGMGGALVCGLKSALESGADLVITMDADLSHAPEDIPRLIAAAEGHQLVLGSRRVDGGSVVGWSRSRDLVSRVASRLSRWLLGLKAHDVTTGFRVYRSDLLREIDLAAVSAKGYAFQEEMVMRAEAKGFSVHEVPIGFIDRRAGKSKLSLTETFASLGTLLRLRLRKVDRRSLAWFGALCVIGLAVRAYFAPHKGYDYDLEAFSTWAKQGRPLSFLNFYAGPDEPKLSFPNYALYFPILALLGPAADAATAAGRALLKTPAIIGDLLLAATVYFSTKPRWRVLAAAFILLGPAIWFDSAVFGQNDSFHALFMTLAVVMLAGKKFRLAWLFLAIAVFFKLQAIAIAPLLFAADWKESGIKKTARHAFPAAVFAIASTVAYALGSSLQAVWNSLHKNVGLFPLVSINAWNPWYLVHVIAGRWVFDVETVLGVSFRIMGLVLFFAAVVAIVWALPKNPRRTTIFAAAAALCFSFFMLPTEIHERYAYPLLPFLALLALESPFTLVVAVAMSFFVFLNVEFMLSWIPAFEPLVRSAGAAGSWSFVSTLIFVFYLGWYFRRCRREKKSAATEG